ncbi:reverse transcriptase domain-containing protein [Tanacetum coccineum]
MADNFRTMINAISIQMLQAPIEGYEDAIVVPPINANNFELKQPLINLVQSNKFTALRVDLDKDTYKIILTWDDLVSKLINQFFPPSKTTYLRNKITNFFQEPNETFNEAWERFKGLLRQCPHHGFSELHQLDTFYNSLNSNDQDALDSAAGGNFLDKMPRDGLAIIESKSKVRYSRSRPNDSRAITNAPSSTSSPSDNSFEIQQMAALLEDKMNIRMSHLEKAISEKNTTTPATVKAVEEVCVNLDNFQRNQNDFKRVYSDSQKKKMILENNGSVSCKAITPTNLQVQVLYQAIPFQIQEMKPRQLRLVVVIIRGPLFSSTVVGSRQLRVTKVTEATKNREIQLLMVQEQTKDKEPIEEPSFVANKAKPNLPYPSRLNKQKIREKDDILFFKLWKSFDTFIL